MEDLPTMGAAHGRSCNDSCDPGACGKDQCQGCNPWQYGLSAERLLKGGSECGWLCDDRDRSSVRPTPSERLIVCASKPTWLKEESPQPDQCRRAFNVCFSNRARSPADCDHDVSQSVSTALSFHSQSESQSFCHRLLRMLRAELCRNLTWAS